GRSAPDFRRTDPVMFVYSSNWSATPATKTLSHWQDTPGRSTAGILPSQVPASGQGSQYGWGSGQQRVAIEGRETMISYGARHGETVRITFGDGSMLVGTFFDSRI